MSVESTAFYVSAHLVVGVLYGALAWAMWRSLQKGGRGDARWFLPLLAAAHAALLASAVVDAGGMRFGFAHALSATLLFTVLVVWAEGFLVPIRGLLVMVLPLAALAAMLPAAFQGTQIAAASETLAFRAHIVIAIAAFSLLTIAVYDIPTEFPAAALAAFNRLFVSPQSAVAHPHRNRLSR